MNKYEKAFPCPASESKDLLGRMSNDAQAGMDLRDVFAMVVLFQSMTQEKCCFPDVCQNAYAVADMMMEARGDGWK